MKHNSSEKISSIKTSDGRTLIFLNTSSGQQAFDESNIPAYAATQPRLSVHQGQARKLRRKFLVLNPQTQPAPEVVTTVTVGAETAAGEADGGGVTGVNDSATDPLPDLLVEPVGNTETRAV